MCVSLVGGECSVTVPGLLDRGWPPVTTLTLALRPSVEGPTLAQCQAPDRCHLILRTLKADRIPFYK